MYLSKITKVALIIALGGVFSAKALAQKDERNLNDYNYIKGSYGWLTSSNAAGLISLPVEHISTLGVNYNQGIGEFVNYYQSDNSYNVNANTESFYRIGDRVVFYGNVSYDYFKGKNMGGSVWSNPYNKSFDILESTDTTRGNKQKEYYHLIGGIGYKVSDKFNIGGSIDYASGNYAKFKDLRHVNHILDMSVSAGVSYKLADLLEVGLNYIYNRNIESIDFNIYGMTDKQYSSIINFGAFYGSSELFGETGYTSEHYPYLSFENGGALQLDFSFSPKISFFNEITFLMRKGSYGLNSYSDVIFSKHSGMIFKYNGLFKINGNNATHLLGITFDYDKMKNSENIFQKSSIDAQTTVEYLGENQVLSKGVTTVGAEYTANLGLIQNTPTWILKGGADLFQRKINSAIYPFFRKQSLHTFAAHLFGNRNFITDKAMYSVKIGAEYGMGGGTKKEDGVYTQPSESQKEPKSVDFALEREWEYLTSSRVNANIGFRYSHFFKKGVMGFVDADYKLTYAMGLTAFQSGMFHSMTITIGCNF